MAININIPSQVKEYADIASFPATGDAKTIYVAEDTNKLYRWDGSTYVEISAAVATTWGNIGGTLSNQTDLNTALGNKENTITAGTTSQYFRGDKTFQTLDKTAVGLSNVDNTSDVNKPISSATQTALNAKQNTLSLTTTGSSGSSTLVGATLNVPTYTLAGLGGITASFLSGGTGITYNSSTGIIASTITQYTDALARGSVSLTTTGSSGSSTYNSTTGVLNVPTYTLSGLGGVPTTRTLTINGTAYDLSADRSWTISTGITIGTTAITSGTVGRILFEGTGNVVSESANLFWDNTNGRLGVGGTPGAYTLDVNGTARVQSYLQVSQTISAQGATNFPASGNGVTMYYNNNGGNLLATSNFGTFATTQLCIQPSGGKLAINTGGGSFTNTNNQLRQVGGAEFSLGGASNSFDFYVNGASGNVDLNLIRPANNVNYGHSLVFKAYDAANSTVTYSGIGNQIVANTTSAHSGHLLLYTTNAGTTSERMRVASTGNVLINTTTDAGYKLDVNGTARVQGTLTVGTSANTTADITAGSSQGFKFTSTYFYDFFFGSTRTHRFANNQYGINSFFGNNIAFGYDPTGGSAASAKIELGAGTATAGTAPLKLRAGTNLTTPENGAFEYDGTNLYFTTGGVRKTVTLI